MLSNLLFQAKTIPHGAQRYSTTGDWAIAKDGAIEAAVSSMDDDRYEFCVGIHEVIEARLCKEAGITDELVCAFDEAYETIREYLYTNTTGDHCKEEYHQACDILSDRYDCKCTPTEESEPGDDIHAPYYDQHQVATGIERIIAKELGVSWNDYEAANFKLYRVNLRGDVN